MFTNSEYNKKKSNKISKKSVNIINKKEKKNNYGLTLMTLIIIIIVMLILAGVTVSLSVGDNGLIKRTKRSVGSFENSSSVDDNNIEEYSEYVKSLVKMPSASEITLTQSPTADMWTNGKVTVSASAGSIDTNKNPILLKKGENSKWEDPGTVENGTITVEENCTVYATFKNTLDKVASDSAHIDISNIDLDYPTNDKPEYTATTSTLTIRCKQTDGTSGIQKYEYSIDGGATWSSGAKGEVTSNDDTVVTSSSKTTVVGGTQYTFTGLEQGKTYQVKTRATDFVGHVTTSETLNDVTTKSVPILVAGTDVTFDSNPSQNTWTKNSVTISATPDEKYKDAYVLQLSSDGTNFKDATNITVDKNGNVYARLRDKRTNADNSENYQYSKNNAIFKVANIDKTAPSTDKPDAVATTCKITVTSNQHDLGDSGSSESGECSGLDDSQTQYRILRDKVDGEDTSKITIDNDTGKVIVRAWQPTGEFTGLDQGIKYYAQTKATDKSGTGNTSVSELTEVTTEKVTDLNDTNVKFESNPSLTTWTKDDVAVKVSTQITDFTLQVAIGNGEWKNATMSSDGKSQSITVTVSSNQRVTARLYDGTNPGGEKFITLDHIDKLKPTDTAPDLAKTNPTSSRITATYKQVDSEAANGYAKSDIKTREYAIKKTSDTDWGEWIVDSATTHTFTNLAAATEYQVKTRATDNANNQIESTVSKITTDAVPTVDTKTQGGSATLKLTADKTTWTNGDVNVTATTNTSGYTIQMSQTSATTGYNDVSKLTFTSNGTAYARLSDGAQTTEVATLNITNIDKLNPTTTAPDLAKTNPTSSRITATYKQVDSEAANGYAKSDIKTREYAIKKTSDTDWGEWIVDSATTHTFTNLAAATEYQVKTRATDNANNQIESTVSKITTDAVPTVDTKTQGGSATLKLTADKTTWTNGDVNVTATTNTSGYTIQMSQTSATTGYNDVSKLTFTSNGTAYARLSDGAQTTGVATLNITNIDKLNPTTTAPNVDTYTTHSVTVKCQQTDSGSGIATYYFSKDSGSTWTAGQTDSSYTFDGLTQNTSYTFATKAIDKAGNPSTSEKVARNTSLVPSGANGVIALTPSTSDWTNGSVTVTATTTQTGYNLQTSTDGTNWGKTNPLTFTANGTAYARLWDGYNGGTAASTAVTNIDKTAPTISSFTAGTVTTSTIPVTVSASDSGGSGISNYKFYLGSELKATQTTSSYTYEGLTAGTSYTLKVVVTDNAGNSKDSSTTASTKTDEVYWFLYSNNSDNSDLTLAFNSTGIPSPTNGQTTFKNGKEISGNISEKLFNDSDIPYKDYTSTITSVKIENKIEPTYTACWFENLSNVTSIDLNNLITSKTKDMNSMFDHCSGLTSIDVSKFDTSNVTNMSWMFYYCTSLLSLDVSNFNTSKVTTMKSMFDNCASLQSLDVSNFDTSSVTNMSWMFAGEGSYSMALTEIKGINKFNTSKVTTMQAMFRKCSKLTSLDLSKWNTSNVTNMRTMFYYCTSLLSLDVSNFDTSKVTDMRAMFQHCEKLPSLDVSKFNTSNVTDMKSMFYYCISLPSLNVSNFDTSKVTNMQGMFVNCTSLLSLDVSNFNTSKVTNMDHMFHYCISLPSLNVSNFDTSKVTNMEGMFDNCASLQSLDVSNFDTSSVTNMGWMFAGEDPYSMALTEIKGINEFNTSKVTTMECMFQNCEKLPSLDVSKFNTSKVTNMDYMFNDCISLPSLNVSNFDTSKVTDMQVMFQKCSKLTSLDLSKWDTSNVTDMSYMFSNCPELTTIYVSSLWTTSSVTSSNYMFAICSKLKGGSGTVFDSNYIDKTYAHIDGGTANPGYFTKSNIEGIATASPTTLTSGDVTVTLPTLTGFTTKYTIDGTAPSTSSTTYTGPFTVSSNCTVLYVYTDGTNINSAGTLGITNIDKTAYTITYNLNGGSISGQPTTYKVDTANITLPAPTRAGYTFNGWTGSNGTTAQTSVTIAKGSRGNKTYTANWEAAYTGYYADVNDDGTVDGVIFIDLAQGASGNWNPGNNSWDNNPGTYSYSAVTSGLRSYKISTKTSSYSGKFGTKSVIAPNGTSGSPRFYVMALSDYDSSRHTWSDAKSKTQAVGSVTFRLPSKMEWAAFGGKLGITTSNYSSTYGLSGMYPSSSEGDSSGACAWYAFFSNGYMYFQRQGLLHLRSSVCDFLSM